MSQDIRKWFTKHKESAKSGSTHVKPSTLEKPAATVPNSGKMEIQECSGRRKTSKCFGQSPKDEMEVEEFSAKKIGQKGNSELTNNVKSTPGKKIHKLEDNEDEDFVSLTSRKNSVNATPNKKLKSGSALDSLKREQAEHLIKPAEDMIKNHGGCDTGSVFKKTCDEDIGGRKSEKVEEFGDMIRGSRGAPVSGRGRGSGGRGGFTNFGERKDPPHKGEKEVPEGAADGLDGLTFVISGTLDSLEREEAVDLIKRHGGRVTGFISKKTNYLLCDEDIGGRKSEKAKELGTKFMTEDGLFDLIRASNKSKKRVTNAAPSPPKKSLQTSERNKQAGRVFASSDTKGLGTVAASLRPKSQPTPQTCLPWTEKYRPKVPNDIVGNQSLVKQLQDWLVHWSEHFFDAGQKGRGKKQNDSGAKKAVLLSGTPGIGKTSSAKLVSQMLGFQTIEVNASDSRGKADGKIERGIGGSTSNLVKELVSNEALSRNMERSKHPKSVLIMDEVDGMSAGDRGGVADLIASIKISKIPIICICNDRYSQKLKSLVNYCLLLSFRKPAKQQIAKRLSQIANAEGLQVNEIALEELGERTNGDIRMALNNLQYMSLSMSVIKFDDMREHLQMGSKDEEISPFTAVDKLFSYNSGKLRMDERIDLCMSDPDLVPLLIQENYINYRPSGNDDNGMRRMNLLARAAESIGDGDIVIAQIRRYRQWQLSQIGSLASCIIPVALLRGQREALEQGERNYNRFGGWLGKNSTMGKNYRLVEDLHVHLLSSRESNLGRTELRLDHLTTLLKRLTDPLKTLSKDEAVKRVLEFMETYSISMEDFDTIMEISKFKGHPNPLDGVQPAVKSALTRAYNKGSLSRVIRSADLIMLPGMKKVPKKRIAAMLEPAEDTLAEDAESEESGSEDESVDPEKEKLQSDMQSLNSKAIKVEMELKGSSSSSAKMARAGRGKGSSAASSRGGRGSGAAAPKRKR